MKLKNLLLIATSFLAAGCAQEMIPPVAEQSDGGGNKVKFRLEVAQPSDPDTKITLEEGAAKPEWTGDETATLIFGIKGTSNSNNPTLTSTAPGVFEGTVTIPDGFTIDDLHGLVVPGENGANFKTASEPRIRMYTPKSQTQATNGVVNPKYVPFFTEISTSDLKQEEDGTYTFSGGGKTLWSGNDLIRFNIYGGHDDSESDEIFKSITLTGATTGSNNVISGTSEYRYGSGSTSYNSNGDTSVGVSLTEELTFTERTKEEGLKVYLGILLGGSRYITKITVKTDKAVYTKSVDRIKLAQDHIEKLNVYKVNIDLSNGFTRSSKITYSSDNGETWQETIPETFSSLAVKTTDGATLTEVTLEKIKTAIAAQSTPVELNLRQAEYASDVFPAVFNGTSADDKSTLIKSVSFPKNVTEIAKNAFAYCSSLESVDLTGITTLNTKAFYFTGLKTLDVPKTVTAIKGYLVFGCCAQLNEIYYDSPSGQYKNSNNKNINHATFAFAEMTSSATNTDDWEMDADKYPELHPTEPQCVVTIGPNVKHLARRMFCYNDNIAKIVFQGSPSSIGNYAFNYIHNVHTFDCRMMSPAISSYADKSYQQELGQSARTAGKELKILVSAGMTDSFKANYPFKWMIANGWTIVEDETEPATLEDVRIGTYNVRIQSSDDGDNNWPTRKTICLQSIKEIDFDIFGLQEAQKYHQEYFAETLTDTYNFEWFCPNTGSSKESIGIAYKKADWSLASVKKFWMSPTPDEQGKYDTGSKGNYYRGAICGTLIHKKTGVKIFFMSAHGCLNPDPNATYAGLYATKEAEYNTEGVPAFFVGDLNAKPTSTSYTTFTGHWTDTYLAVDETKREGCEYTYNGFKNPNGSSRIDYVFYRGNNATPTYYKCDNTLYGDNADKYPSDHWPVYADFTIAPATAVEE